MSIGEYNKLTDLKYDLSSFYQLTQSEITKLNLYIDKTTSNITGLEFFYGDLSTGVFHHNSIKEESFDVNNNKSLIIKEINLSNNNIEEIEAMFIENKILKLLFCSKSEKIGYNIVDYVSELKENTIETLLPGIRKTNIKLNTQKLVSFEFSFNEEGLTFLRPNFHVDEKLIPYNDEKKYFSTISFGKKFNDSNEYKFNSAILKEEYKLQKLFLYHDGNLMKGFEMYYKLNDKTLVEKFGRTEGIKDCLDLNVEYGEFIDQVLLRTGDLMDGIMIKTNKGQLVVSGGTGGGAHFYNLRNGEKKYEFIGLEGLFSGCIQQVKMIVKEI